MHRFIDGEDRMQPALLPHSLEDYVSEENPVRVIDRGLHRRTGPCRRILEKSRVNRAKVVYSPLKALGRGGGIFALALALALRRRQNDE
jgi:hypothetical protein